MNDALEEAFEVADQYRYQAENAIGRGHHDRAQVYATLALVSQVEALRLTLSDSLYEIEEVLRL